MQWISCSARVWRSCTLSDCATSWSRNGSHVAPFSSAAGSSSWRLPVRGRREGAARQVRFDDAHLNCWEDFGFACCSSCQFFGEHVVPHVRSGAAATFQCFCSGTAPPHTSDQEYTRSCCVFQHGCQPSGSKSRHVIPVFCFGCFRNRCEHELCIDPNLIKSSIADALGDDDESSKSSARGRVWHPWMLLMQVFFNVSSWCLQMTHLPSVLGKSSH